MQTWLMFPKATRLKNSRFYWNESEIGRLNVIAENEKPKNFVGNFYAFLLYLIFFHVCMNTIDQIIPQYQWWHTKRCM